MPLSAYCVHKSTWGIFIICCSPTGPPTALPCEIYFFYVVIQRQPFSKWFFLFRRTFAVLFDCVACLLPSLLCLARVKINANLHWISFFIFRNCTSEMSFKFSFGSSFDDAFVDNTLNGCKNIFYRKACLPSMTFDRLRWRNIIR